MFFKSIIIFGGVLLKVNHYSPFKLNKYVKLQILPWSLTSVSRVVCSDIGLNSNGAKSYL